MDQESCDASCVRIVRCLLPLETHVFHCWVLVRQFLPSAAHAECGHQVTAFAHTVTLTKAGTQCAVLFESGARPHVELVLRNVQRLTTRHPDPLLLFLCRSDSSLTAARVVRPIDSNIQNQRPLLSIPQGQRVESEEPVVSSESLTSSSLRQKQEPDTSMSLVCITGIARPESGCRSDARSGSRTSSAPSVQESRPHSNMLSPARKASVETRESDRRLDRRAG